MHRLVSFAVAAALLLPPPAAQAYWRPWPYPPFDLGIAGSGSPNQVATADFDGDGDLDIVADASASSAWFENLGNRTFGPAQAFAGAPITLLGAGDWNGDGHADVLEVQTIDFVPWVVAARLGDGQGGFAPPVTLFDFTGSWPAGWPTPLQFGGINGFVASDLNGDGRVEVVLSFSSSDGGVINRSLLIHMDPVLGGAPVLIDTSDMAGSGPPVVGDIDADGQQDVVWLDKQGTFPSTLTWFERTGGTWGAGGSVGPDTDRAAVVADVYGLDGHADVLTDNGDLFWQDPCCQPYFTQFSYPASNVARHAFDYDHDGDLDLSVSRSPPQDGILENANGVGTSWLPRSNGIEIPLALADLDGDGAQDVIGTTSLGGTVPWRLSVAFNPQTVHAILAPPNGAAGRTALIAATGSVEDFAFSATTVAQANEVAPPITENHQLGSVLTFPRSATGQCHSFTVRSLQSGAQLVFDDQEGSAAWNDALSIGDIDNHELDSFLVTFDGAVPVHGFGLHLLDNSSEAGEEIEVTDPSGFLLNEIYNETIPGSTGDTTSYIGFWSAEPVGSFVFYENPSGDDIGIERLSFATGWDTDGDALSDCQEQELTTGWNDSDSDNDGLTDGEEVVTYGTNPLLTDTDGDGFDDPTEINAGTDPLDALSFPSPSPEVPVMGAFGMLLLALALMTTGATALRRRSSSDR